MESKAISNTGPIIHLTEINLIEALEIFSKVYTSLEVANELKKHGISLPKSINLKLLNGENKDKVKILAEQNELDLGEAEAIILSIQEKPAIFLTDDLDARITAKELGIEVHGTIGVILKTFQKKIISKQKAIEKINSLTTASSLFITSDLINKVLNELEKF